MEMEREMEREREFEMEMEMRKERIKERKKQRQIFDEITSSKAVFVKDDEKFYQFRDKNNERFEKVSHVREAQYDCKIVNEFLDVVKIQVAQFNEVSLRIHMRTITNSLFDRFYHHGAFSWNSYGKAVGSIMTAVPKISTMVGPLMRREKVRKVAVRRLRVDEDNVVETVQKRTREEDDDDIESEVTNVRQKKMKSELNNKLLEEDTSILSFLVDPEDHVQTIENFFDLSFLVKVQTPFKSIIFETRTNGIY